MPSSDSRSSEQKSKPRWSFSKLKKLSLALLSTVLFTHATQAQDAHSTKVDKPTTEDSLRLYNNTNELLDYYSAKNKYEDMGTRQIDPKLYSITKKNMAAVDDMNKRIENKKFPWTNRRYESFANNAWQLIKGFTFGKVETDHLDPDYSFEPADYYQKENKYQYKQRELQNNIIDMESPMQLYDSRIDPTMSYAFINKNNKHDGLRGGNPVYGDVTTFYGYDPIAIKPEGMRTQQDWLYLNKKYGTPIPGQSKIKTPNPAPVIKKEVVSPVVKTNPVELLKKEPVQKTPVKSVVTEQAPDKKNLSQYSRIVNGQRIPITKEEYDSLLKAGQSVSEYTTALYDKTKYKVVPKK